MRVPRRSTVKDGSRGSATLRLPRMTILVIDIPAQPLVMALKAMRNSMACRPTTPSSLLDPRPLRPLRSRLQRATTVLLQRLCKLMFRSPYIVLTALNFSGSPHSTSEGPREAWTGHYEPQTNIGEAVALRRLSTQPTPVRQQAQLGLGLFWIPEFVFRLLPALIVPNQIITFRAQDESEYHNSEIRIAGVQAGLDRTAVTIEEGGGARPVSINVAPQKPLPALPPPSRPSPVFTVEKSEHFSARRLISLAVVKPTKRTLAFLRKPFTPRHAS